MEKGYKRLKVYQEAHKLVLKVYRATSSFPKAELFGLVSQMRRAVISIVANVLEGQARFSNKEFHRFVSIANGSLVELEYYFELALELKYINVNTYEDLEGQRSLVGSLLGGLRRYLKHDA